MNVKESVVEMEGPLEQGPTNDLWEMSVVPK